jgi:hypothetical protein
MFYMGVSEDPTTVHNWTGMWVQEGNLRSYQKATGPFLKGWDQTQEEFLNNQKAAMTIESLISLSLKDYNLA